MFRLMLGTSLRIQQSVYLLSRGKFERTGEEAADPLGEVQECELRYDSCQRVGVSGIIHQCAIAQHGYL